MYALSHIHYLTVFFAGLVYMGFGFLWYSPLLAGNAWMKLMGYGHMTKDQMAKMRKEAAPAYTVSLFTSFLTAFTVAWILGSINNSSTFTSVFYILFIWLGLAATTTLTGNMFNKKPLTLWLIDSGYQFFGLILVTILLKYWS